MQSLATFRRQKIFVHFLKFIAGTVPIELREILSPSEILESSEHCSGLLCLHRFFNGEVSVIELVEGPPWISNYDLTVLHGCDKLSRRRVDAALRILTGPESTDIDLVFLCQVVYSDLQLGLDILGIFLRAFEIGAIPIAPLERFVSRLNALIMQIAFAMNLRTFDERVKNGAILIHPVSAELEVRQQISGYDDCVCCEDYGFH